ncbi:hypothetical protein ACFX13_008998 [Malus domestica]
MVDSLFATGARRPWLALATLATNVSIPISPTTSTKHARIYPVRSATLSTVKHPLKLQCFKDPFTVYTCDSCDQPCRIAYTCSDCELNLDVKCASNWRLILEDR